MNNNLISIHLASTIVTTYYEMLKKLSSDNKEDTIEFREIVTKLRTAIAGETNIYENLTSEDVKFIDEYFKDNEPYNITEARIYNRIGNHKRLKNKDAIKINKNILLSSVITSKLIIDVLKSVKVKIDNLDDFEKAIVNLYSNMIKYTYLSANNFIETLASEYNYDIDAMPTIDFYKLEEATTFKFVEYSQPLFVKYITDSINLLTNIEDTERYDRKYNYLFELSRIEIMLPYLDKTSLLKIKQLCQNIDNPKINASIQTLIKKKEKDFE